MYDSPEALRCLTGLGLAGGLVRAVMVVFRELDPPHPPPPGTTDQGNGKGRSVVRPMGTAAHGGKGQGKGKGRGEGRLGQGGRGRSKSGEKPMGTTAYGGKGSKGRAANGDRPVGAARCRRDHHTMASCQNPSTPPPPLDPPPPKRSPGASAPSGRGGGGGGWRRYTWVHRWAAPHLDVPPFTSGAEWLVRFLCPPPPPALCGTWGARSTPAPVQASEIPVSGALPCTYP